MTLAKVFEAKAPAGASITTGSIFPNNCAPLRVKIPADQKAPGLRLYFTDAAIEDILLCNPKELRQSNASSVSDVSRFRQGGWQGVMAQVHLNEAGEAVVGIPDGERGGLVTAVLCAKAPKNLMGRWGSFIPSVVPLEEFPPSIDLNITCGPLRGF